MELDLDLDQVVSDWGGTHSTRLAAEAGLDMEMSDATYFTEDKLRVANVTESTINGMVYRILRSMFAAGLFERASEPGGEGNMRNDARSDAHRKLAADLAVAGTILLRNEGKLLPLPSSLASLLASPDWDIAGDDEQISEPDAKPDNVRIAVIGDEFTAIGGEAGQLGWPGRGPDYLVTPSEAIARHLAGQNWRPRVASRCVKANGVDYTPMHDTCVTSISIANILSSRYMTCPICISAPLPCCLSAMEHTHMQLRSKHGARL
eukprot:COSAG02_NODE_56_length_43700_cov_33.650765_11_plen_263_part_00